VYRNGIAVRPDPDFHHDMEHLIRGIKDVGSGSSRRWPRRVRLVGLATLLAVLVLLLLGVLVNVFRNEDEPPPNFGFKIEVKDPKRAAGKEPVRLARTAGGTGRSRRGPVEALHRTFEE
jgi:hypothetical protein